MASVSTGNTGVVTTFGKVENYTFEAGMHFKAPWNSVVQMDNRVQKTTVELPCFSSDIQEVNTVYTVNYQISKTNAQNLYRDVGTNYLETVVTPTIQETVKTVIARYKAEELISNRAEVAAEIETLLTANLQRYNIDVASTAIENMDFTDSFTNAVEAKAVAAQNKLQAEIEQAQALAKAENDKKIAKENAEAKAETDRINANAQAEIAEIQANADKLVAQINADSAEYQGKKEAAIALQRLASINGWTVVHNNETGINELYKANGNKVEEDELLTGAQRLIEYYYTQTWDGKLPDTFVGDGDVSNIIIGNN
jgi:regulator of protease activity HflC (stomatin/prohibitin superfamily)